MAGNGQWRGPAVNQVPPSSADVFDAYSTPVTSLPGRIMHQLTGAVKQGQVYFKFYLLTTSCRNAVWVSLASHSVGPGLSSFRTPAVLDTVLLSLHANASNFATTGSFHFLSNSLHIELLVTQNGLF
jgi:hypothetical protein